MIQRILICGLVILITACGDNPAIEPEQVETSATATMIKPSPSDIAFAEATTPADAGLAAKYDRSCRTCHSLVNAGAPLAGHQEAWKVRLDAKPIDELVSNTKTGLNAMPPMGLCNDCSDQEFAALIHFMAGTE